MVKNKFAAYGTKFVVCPITSFCSLNTKALQNVISHYCQYVLLNVDGNEIIFFYLIKYD